MAIGKTIQPSATQVAGVGNEVQKQNERAFKGEVKLAQMEFENPLMFPINWAGDRAKDILTGLLAGGLYAFKEGWSQAQPFLEKAGIKIAAKYKTAEQFLIAYAKGGAKNLKNVDASVKAQLNAFMKRPDVQKMLAQHGVMQTNAGKPSKMDPSGFPTKPPKTPLKDQSGFPVDGPPGEPTNPDKEALDDITNPPSEESNNTPYPQGGQGWNSPLLGKPNGGWFGGDGAKC